MDSGKTKSRQRLVFFFIGTLSAVLAVILTGILLAQVTSKMNRSANEALVNSCRMIKEGIEGKMESDEELLSSFAALIAEDVPADMEERLASYKKASDFFELIYLGMDGTGTDSTGRQVGKEDLAGAGSGLPAGIPGVSETYHGDSGRVQITYQTPVEKDGNQAGILYAEKILDNYKNSALFSFRNGKGRAYLVNKADGTWLIEGRGVLNMDTIYEYLNMENGDSVSQALKNYIGQGKSGTINIISKGEDCLLCFLPMEEMPGSYLIAVVPKVELQQESQSILNMVRAMLVLLSVGAVLILLLFLGRQSMKVNAAQKEYREKLFQNLSANIDFAFLLYTPGQHRTELVSENISTIVGADLSSPEEIFDRCGLDREDKDRKTFMTGRLDSQIVRECRIGTEKNEVTRWIELHLVPADYGQQLLVLSDSTKDHHMRESLADALYQAQSTNEARTTFFSAMSHDLRTPMNGIIGMTHIALANTDNAVKVRSCLGKIMTASEHLLSLINEILDMSRIESGKMSMKVEEVHLPSMIANILEFIDPEIKRKCQELSLRSTVLEYDTVMSDSLHLQKILLNLLSNAVKYTPEGGRISLSIEEERLSDKKLQIRFTVEDNGIGMSPDFQERIFMPFEREEDSRSSRAVGTGLGMPIVKGIVDMMDGDIELESEEGRGSRFTVILPLSYVDRTPARTAELDGCSVLVVDDEQDACESISLMLREAGVNSHWVIDGKEAVCQVKKAHERGKDYSAVILDWKMPEMDGLETARRIRAELGKDIPILLLSAYNWENVKEEALEIGIDGFLTKPIFRSQLIEQLKHQICVEYGLEEVEPPDERTEMVYPDLSRMNILVAEDNELNMEIITEILSRCGARITGAGNGREALTYFTESSAGHYQMIFMDVHMPEMDGLEAARAIRQSDHPDAKTIPVIAMTADAFHEDVRKCLAAGMNEHIGKPIEMERLFAVAEQFKSGI